MVKAVYSVNHKGLTDWLVQHISAFILALYTLGVVAFLMCHSGIDFETWHGLFQHTGMKVATAVVFLLLLMHAWIGIWTVITDYVKCAMVRLSLYVVILVGFVALFMTAVLILWGVN